MAFAWDAFESVATNPETEDGEFNWDSFPSAISSQIGIPKSQQIEEYTPEELKDLGISEKLAYGRQLAAQRQYRSGKGFVKGATLGASQYVPGLKVEEGEEGTGGGELAGILLPMLATQGLVGLLPQVTKNLPKALQVGEKILRSAAVGGALKGTEEAISGKVPGIETLKSAGEFGGLHALLMAAGSGGRYLSNMIKKLPSKEVKALENVLFEGKPPRRSLYELREETLNELKPKPEEALIKEEGKLPFGQTSGEGKPLKGRIKQKFDELGLKPPEAEAPRNLKEEVGRIFSDQPFYNTTEGGKALKNEIIKLDQQKYRQVNKAYEQSKKLNENIEEIHPNLYRTLEQTRDELSKIPAPSGPQKDLITSLDKIIDSMTEYRVGENGKFVLDEEGNKIFEGYKPVSNQVLLDQAKSLRQKIDYDFAHGNAKNIFKPTIGQLEDAALVAAEESGNLEAVEALKDAKGQYKEWVETFDSDYVRPFRDVTNKDYSKLFKGSLDLDESNVLKDILNKSPEGQKLVKASSRELVEKHLGKFFENPKSYTSDEFKKALREINAVISPEESKAIQVAFESNAPAKIKFRAKQVPPQLSKSVEKTSEYLNKSPEYIGEKLKDRTGIRQLRNDLSKTEKGKKLFEENVKQKARSILKEGKIHRSSKVEDYYKVLNEESNREIMAEIMGENEINEILDELAKKENQNLRLNSIKGIGKKYATLKFLKYVWPLL